MSFSVDTSALHFFDLATEDSVGQTTPPVSVPA